MFKRIINLAILLLLATCPAWAATAPQLDLGSTTVTLGATTVTIPVTLTNVSGTTLGSVGTTIKFDTTVLGSPSIAVGPVATAAGKSASGSLDPADSSKFTIGIFGFNVTAIADGVVAYVTFNILNTGTTTLTNIITSDSGSNPNGDPVAMTGANGTITIPAPATYTVTYNGNGSTGGTAPTDTGAYQSGTTVTVSGSGTLTKTGYTFAGWNTAANGSGTSRVAAATFSMGTANVTLYAQWTANNYTVTFNSNGGSAVSSQSIAYNTAATQPTAPTKTGSTFSGWYSDSALTTAFVFTTAITADSTLYAKWTTSNYTVTFNNNGGSAVASQSIAYNSTASQPTAPVKTGSTFAGWYSDSALTTSFAFTTAITADTALYAKWTVNNYTVTFNSNGGGSVSSQSIAYNSTASQPTAPVKTGLNFAGWYSDSNLTTPFAFTTAITADTALYAKWTANTVPAAPVNISAAAGNGQAVITFTEPSNNGGSAITGYTAISTPGGITATGTVSPLTVTGLANGVEYTFTVAAINSIGTGAASISSNAVTPSLDDKTAPVLTLSMLSDGSATNNQTINVSGNVKDLESGLKTLVINGGQATVATDGSFSVALTLAAGSNLITVVATDNANNETKETRTVVFDITVPTITIAAPSDNIITKTVNIMTTGTVNESSVVTVRVNSESWQSATLENGNFNVQLFLMSGLNTIEVSATDTAGNVATIKRTVRLDVDAPALAVTEPAQDMTTGDKNITLAGSVSDAAGGVTVSISHAGQVFTPAVNSGAFTQQITFDSAKSYPVVVTATDEAGNVTTATRNIIYHPSDVSGADLNGDGSVTIADALKALHVSIGLAVATAEEISRGDVAPLVNGKPVPDGKIDIADAVVILERSVGLISW